MTISRLSLSFFVFLSCASIMAMEYQVVRAPIGSNAKVVPVRFYNNTKNVIELQFSNLADYYGRIGLDVVHLEQ